MKNVLIYLLAVGGSVLAILGLLYLGDDVRAPMSVGGAWKLESAPTCGMVPEAAAELGLKISQSGPHLEIQLGDSKGTLLHGELDGSRIVAETRKQSPGVRLQTEVEKSGGEARMEGTLDVDGCEAAIPVRAIHEKPPVGGARGH